MREQSCKDARRLATQISWNSLGTFRALALLEGMSTPAYYQSEAARCRELATKSRDADAIKRWLLMALGYEQLAETMASASQAARSAPQMQRMPIQQQEIQQHQSKIEPDKD
jgi:hypothetical protein